MVDNNWPQFGYDLGFISASDQMDGRCDTNLPFVGRK